MLKQTCMLGLVCACVSGAASAQLTSTSTISNFSCELIDLAPNDGVAALLSCQALAPEGHQSNSMAYVYRNIPERMFYDAVQADGTRPLATLSVSKTTLRGSGPAGVTGEPGKALAMHASVASVMPALAPLECPDTALKTASPVFTHIFFKALSFG